MEKFKVVVTDYVFDNLDTERAIIEPCGATLLTLQCENVDELIPITVDADAILNTYLGPLDERFFSTLERCKLIVRYGIGIDTIDIKAATRHGIMVANVPDYCINEVSDHALACMLALARKLKLSDQRIHEGEWDLSYLKPVHRTGNLSVGIVGMGRIGRLSARKVAAFGAKVVFADPFINGDIIEDGLHAKKVTLEELAASSDVILIHAAATPETYHLFDAKLFDLMQKKPIIVNCARGSLIDTEALVSALLQGKISGAALDVIEGVPPISPEHPLCKFENVILTPHSAWYSEDALKSLQRLAAEEVARVLKGGLPRSLINPEVLSSKKTVV